MKKSLLPLSVASIAAFAPGLAYADDLSPETVVVTATRTPQPLDVTGTSMSIITSKNIETQQIDVVGDALAQTPGLAVVRNGGIGQSADILLRGAEAGQTLVLVDGVRINDPSATSGFALLGDVLANGIDRIEILRGPQSTLYGGDAIGGVVNILTTRGGEKPFVLHAQAEGGSFDTYRFNVSANGSDGAVEYGAAANYYGSNSVSAADARNGNSEADGYHNLGLTGNLRWHATDTVSFDARVYYTHARDSFDGYPPPTYTFQDTHQYGRNDLLAAYAGANISLLNGRFSNRFAVIRSDSDRKTFDPTLTPSEDFFAKGGATRFEYQGVFNADDANQATFGAETQTTTLDTHSIYDPTPDATKGSDRINGYYAQWQTSPIAALTLTGGVRYDDDREFKGHTSVKLAGAWQMFGATTLRANYGDGFKAPSLYELYSPYSNPVDALKPETAKGWEVGIDQGFWNGRLRGSLTYFERRTKDQIDFFSCYGVTSTACTLRAAQGGYYYNIGRSRATGVEADISAKLSDTLSLTANYTNLTDTDLATGLQLARRPQNSANAVVTWLPTPDATLGISVDYVGKRFDDAGHFTPLDAAAHVKLFGSFKLCSRWELFGRIENLFGDRAEPAAGYGAMGRAFYAGVRASL
ncbi:MAG: TonB-dependent receptor [Alphaproteobacteria bacterium]|nr:TonB-dependent receptor [Alphaproteobacteria bacterium]MDE2111368.1 TonB-dependent receptor [Alphaproteobacteria bacterium]